jgi:hypothetical protein
LASDVEFGDEGSIDGSIAKGPKGGKGKQAKASSSKTKIDGVVISTRKSTRLNAPPDKKPRITRGDTPDIPESLFHRLGVEFAAIGKTCDEIAEYLRK